jgi:hypothetical protein
VPSVIAFKSSVDIGVGTDMDCSGSVNANDFWSWFYPQFKTGPPGPSGLDCAGRVPCFPFPDL